MNQYLFIVVFIALFGLHESLLGKGMTWKWISHDSALDIDKVGCVNCDAKKGDYPCSKALPILCVSTCGYKRPPYQQNGCTTGCAKPPEYYDGWSGGYFKLTSPILGTSLKSSKNMDSICQTTFGSSFVVAEHHMGKYVIGMSNSAYFYNSWPSSVQSGGWAARGYGSINTASNFWVYINDQPANCWN